MGRCVCMGGLNVGGGQEHACRSEEACVHEWGEGRGWGMHVCRVLTICTRVAVQEPRSGPCSSTLGTPGCRGEIR